jgi:hypothetical protein
MNYNKNLILLCIAVAAIGVFIIPSTMSMFVGQHRWYSVTTASSQYDLCERCHIAEVGEWKANTGAHSAYRARVTPDPGCFCHQVNRTKVADFGFNSSLIKDYKFEVFNETGLLNTTAESWNWTNGTSWRSQSTPHAAITIECVDCHYNASSQLNNTEEAHKSFYEQTKNTTNTYGSNNTACMACHTMVGLNITMTRIRSGIIINATHNSNYTWTVNVSTNTTEMTSNSTYIPPNNGTG